MESEELKSGPYVLCDCPQPPKWAYRKAKKGIKEGQADYKVDQEEQAV